MAPDTVPDAAPDLPADAATRAAPPRCPACGAAVRADAPWCTQCWSDLQAPGRSDLRAPGRSDSRAATPVPVPAPDGPLDGPADPATGWPCPCGARNALADDVCADCGAGLFAVLRSGSGAVLAVPVLGDVAGLSKLRLALAAGALLPVLVALLLAALALAGALLT